jgi:transposase
LKEQLHGFTQEEIFDKKNRKKILELEKDTALSIQIALLMQNLEFLEVQISKLQDKILENAAPFMREIDILTSMKGISVFIAIAIIADIINIDRFKNSKAFTSYLRSAPRVSTSNTSKPTYGTNKKGRKLSSTLITQSLKHVLDASEKLNRWYTNLTQYKKKGLVRTALRRRVFAEIYQMIKKGEYHYGREEKKHNTKMRQYKNFLKKRNILVETA